MDEVKIQIPDNCELIKDGGTYIVKEKKQELPRSWREFCKRYPIRKKERYISSLSLILPTEAVDREAGDKNFCTSKEEAEAFLALMQLRQLRKAWVGDWETPIDANYGVIFLFKGSLKTAITTNSGRVLSFPTQKMADDFFSCFKDLCETAKILL